MRVERSIPILEGDRVRLLGGGEEGQDLSWHLVDSALVIEIPEVVLERVSWAWAFQIIYQ